MIDDDETDAVEADAQTPNNAKAEAQTVDKSVLIDRIVAGSGLPKPQVRKIIDAALVEIGLALDSGASLSLPPLGKLRSVRQTEKGGTPVHTLKLRRSPARDAKEVASNDAGAPMRSAGAQARARLKGAPSAKRVRDQADRSHAASPKEKPAGDQRSPGKPSKQARGKAPSADTTLRGLERVAAETPGDGRDSKS